jgi:hypothetical protein
MVSAAVASAPAEPVPGESTPSERIEDELHPFGDQSFEANSPEPAPVEPDLAEPQPTYTPPFTTHPEEEVKPVSTELPDVVGGIFNPTPKPETDFKSIAMQINDILQFRLAGTDLASRGITLQDGPDRGVMVTLDGKQYSGVMEVPDENVRDIIRDAVVEWETRR